MARKSVKRGATIGTNPKSATNSVTDESSTIREVLVDRTQAPQVRETGVFYGGLIDACRQMGGLNDVLKKGILNGSS